MHYYCSKTDKMIPKAKREKYKKEGIGGTLCGFVEAVTTDKSKVTCEVCKKKLKDIPVSGSFRLGDALYKRFIQAEAHFEFDKSKILRFALNRYKKAKEQLNISDFKDNEPLTNTVTYRMKQSLLDCVENDSELRFALAYQLDSCPIKEKLPLELDK